MNIDDTFKDVALVLAVRDGSLTAFNIVYLTYAPQLLEYIGKASKRKEDAEEVVHDIFIEFWNNRSKLTESICIKKLLFSIAYKRRIDLFRQSLNQPIFQDYADFQNELISEDNSPLEYHEFCEKFERALQQLPLRLKKLIVLSRIKGLSNKQIAQNLNISEGTVKNGISLGLKSLKNLL